ncbi:Carboxyl/Cholinesterase 31 [Frankliniella occidentalis]|nr:Carboxyl/Cholinesterase 31 [Frankliniella occidentalis]
MTVPLGRRVAAAALSVVIALASASAEALAASASASGSPSSPSATTAGGEVRGLRVPAERGAPAFDAFLGIPYAKPPLGPLRYKFPKPAQPWDGVRDATADPPACAQINDRSATKEVVGQEDCLYLNVYRPEGAEALPVVVVVPDGGLLLASGRMDHFGPHFLVAQRVVVVSVNYRTGPFGFLSLDSDEIPGNAGLKDIVAALRWVKTNIAAFGVDPSKTTVLSWSSGASLVHILSLLRKPRELFSRAVLLSGHGISPRAYTERHLERAAVVAEALGAPSNGSHQEVRRALMEASAEALLRACDDPRVRLLGLPLPSPERRNTKGAEPKLLRQDPESLLRQPEAPPLPVLMGLAGREGSFPYKIWGLGERTPGALDELLPRLLPADVLPGADTAGQLLVRDEYAAGGAIGNNTDTFIEFLGDAFLYASAWRAVGFMANASTEAAPLYLCRMAVDDAYNYGKKKYGVVTEGASHGDDIGYLGRSDRDPELNQNLSGGGVASKTLILMTKIVGNFAKGLAPIEGWPAVPSVGEVQSWPVLQVGPGSRRHVEHADGKRQPFWASVYRDLRSASSTISRS